MSTIKEYKQTLSVWRLLCCFWEGYTAICAPSTSWAALCSLSLHALCLLFTTMHLDILCVTLRSLHSSAPSLHHYAHALPLLRDLLRYRDELCAAIACGCTCSSASWAATVASAADESAKGDKRGRRESIQHRSHIAVSAKETVLT